jgi:hypothetical protein
LQSLDERLNQGRIRSALPAGLFLGDRGYRVELHIRRV